MRKKKSKIIQIVWVGFSAPSFSSHKAVVLSSLPRTLSYSIRDSKAIDRVMSITDISAVIVDARVEKSAYRSMLALISRDHPTVPVAIFSTDGSKLFLTAARQLHDSDQKSIQRQKFAAITSVIETVEHNHSVQSRMKNLKNVTQTTRDLIKKSRLSVIEGGAQDSSANGGLRPALKSIDCSAVPGDEGKSHPKKISYLNEQGIKLFRNGEYLAARNVFESALCLTRSAEKKSVLYTNFAQALARSPKRSDKIRASIILAREIRKNPTNGKIRDIYKSITI